MNILKKLSLFFLLIIFSFNYAFSADTKVILGNERLIPEYHNLIDNKKIGIITNQTGINSFGEKTFEVLSRYPNSTLTAIYTPEHGLDGLSPAGKYVSSYIHPELNIPVYSLYDKTRMPSEEMLKNVDVLIFDIQDIGSRTYTFISTLNYCMLAAKKYDKEIIVLDRPNPLGGNTIDGFVLEDKYKSFVGIDNLPMAHGMTIGEIANFFNRNINCKLSVVPMANYTRDMIYSDTGLPWTMTSPNIPNLTSAFGYMATGMGEGTGIGQGDKFTWVGGNKINSKQYADLLNSSKLEGVTFIPENKGTKGGVRLVITDFKKFNPIFAKVGIYTLSYAYKLTKFAIPKSDKNIIMFEKILGTSRYGLLLKKGYSPKQIVDSYQSDLNKFKNLRSKYLIYQ